MGAGGELPKVLDFEKGIIYSSGIYHILFSPEGSWINGLGCLLMVGVGLLLLYLAIHKECETLLLIPIGVSIPFCEDGIPRTVRLE